jgi:peptide/nickel transport system substrate-binding protein
MRLHRPVLALLALVVSTSAVACSSGDADDEKKGGSAPGDVTAGGTLVFASDVEPDCLDPGTSAFDITAVVGSHLFDTLLWQAPDGEIGAGLAETWEVNDDASQYTFHLREGVTFSDGTPLDAAAVKATFDRIVDPTTGSQYASGLLGPYAGSKVIDDLTVEVDFDSGYAPFLQAATQGFLGILSPTAIADGKNPCTEPVGSGPFTLGEFTPQDRIVLDRRDDYDWAPADEPHQGPANLDEVVFRVVPEDEVRVGLLRNGEVDAIGVVPPLEVGPLEDEGYAVERAEAPGAPYVMYLNTSRAPWTDVDLRRAVQAAVDLDSIVSSVFDDRYPRAWGPLSPQTPGYDASVEGTWGGDPELATSLIEGVGWTKGSDGFYEKDGEPLTLELAYFSGDREQRNEIVTLVQSQLKDVGIDLQLIPEAQAGDALAGNSYDAGEFSFVSGDPDILSTLFSSANVGKDGNPGSNMAAVRDPEIDADLATGVSSTDPDARAAAYAAVQERVVDQAYAIPIYVPSYYVATADGVGGVEFGPQSDVRFFGAYRTD